MSKGIREDGRKNNKRPEVSKEERKEPITIYRRVKEIKTAGRHEDLKTAKAKVREFLGTLFDEIVVENS